MYKDKTLKELLELRFYGSCERSSVEKEIFRRAENYEKLKNVFRQIKLKLKENNEF